MESLPIWTHAKPRPDKTILPALNNRTLVDTIYSASEEKRAVVIIDEKGYYRVLVEVWHISESIDSRWAYMSSWNQIDSAMAEQESDAFMIARSRVRH
jgi:hypothetical protein